MPTIFAGARFLSCTSVRGNPFPLIDMREDGQDSKSRTAGIPASMGARWESRTSVVMDCATALGDQPMSENGGAVSRRGLLRGLGMGAVALGGSLPMARGALAEELVRTPRQTEGPFYPDHLPLDTDNDLLIINDSITPAVGEITYLSGRLLDAHGDPIRGATIEIWQVDGRGSYLHSQGEFNKRDANFQGYG
jgi:hypothetical protein